MGAFDENIDSLLDKLGIPRQKQSPITDYTPINSPKLSEEDSKDSDYKDLKRRGEIFKRGAILIAKKNFSALKSNSLETTIAELYTRGHYVKKICTDDKLLVLKEQIIRTKYDLESVVTGFGLSKKRDNEVSYRLLVALSVDANDRPIYVHILVNPDFDVEQLREYFIFSDESIAETKHEIEKFDLTKQVDEQLENHRNKLIEEMKKQAEKVQKKDK